MTPEVFRKLAPETRKPFKKHTPAIRYLALADPHTQGKFSESWS
jgi:hypothetical protein